MWPTSEPASAVTLGASPAWTELARVARRVVNVGRRVIALVPAGDTGPVDGLGVDLAHALVELGGGPVGFVERYGRWRSFEHAPDFRAEVGYRARDAGGGVDLIAGAPQPHAFAAAAVLETLLPQAANRYERLVVDLTGLERLCGTSNLARVITGFLLVASPGRTRSQEVWRLFESVPIEGRVGVVLHG